MCIANYYMLDVVIGLLCIIRVVSSSVDMHQYMLGISIDLTISYW